LITLCVSALSISTAQRDEVAAIEVNRLDSALWSVLYKQLRAIKTDKTAYTQWTTLITKQVPEE